MNATMHYSADGLERFYSPRNYGCLDRPTGHARITGPSGDTLEIWLLVSEDRIVRATFTTDGCGAMRACGSMATELASGKSLEEAGAIRPDDLVDTLGGLREESRHCALLAVDALKAALTDVRTRQAPGADSRNGH